MKTLYSFLILLSTAGFLSAQNVFPGSGAYWGIQIGLYSTSARHYYSKGDTTISNQSYTKVYLKSFFGSNLEIHYHGAYRVEGEKVYFLAKNSSEEYLLYDFSLQVGDTLPYKERDRKFTVASVDSVYYYGRLRKRQTFRLALNIGYIIEGIGSFFGPFETRYWDALDSQYTLRCFAEELGPTLNNIECEPRPPLSLLDEEKKKTPILVFPNPSKGLFTFHSSDDKAKTITVYDSKGKACLELPHVGPNQPIDLTSKPKGIYYLRTSEGQEAKLLVE